MWSLTPYVSLGKGTAVAISFLIGGRRGGEDKVLVLMWSFLQIFIKIGSVCKEKMCVKK